MKITQKMKVFSLLLILIFIVSAVNMGQSYSPALEEDTNNDLLTNNPQPSEVETLDTSADEELTTDLRTSDSDQVQSDVSNTDPVQATVSSMNPVDVDGNGLAEYLSVTVTIDFNESSLYDIDIDFYKDGSYYPFFEDSRTRYYSNFSTDLTYTIPAFQMEGLTSGDIVVKLYLTDNTNNQLLMSNEEIGRQYVDMSTFEVTDFVVYTDQITDEFKDRDGNSLYEEIVIKVKVFVNTSMYFDIRAYIYHSYSSQTSINQNNRFLSNGTHTLTFKFSTDAISSSGSGDLTFRMNVESTGSHVTYLSTSTILHTLSMSPDISQFRNRQIFYQSAVMTSKDTDEDGYFDYLLVNATFFVNRSDHYDVDARLINESSSFLVQDSTTQSYDYIFFPRGTHTVNFIFRASDIRQEPATFNAPYNVTFHFDGIQIGKYEGSTLYSTSDFEQSPITPTGTFTERSVDIDGDTLNEFFVIDMDVEVREPGMYRFSGYMQNNSYYDTIYSDNVHRFLTVGVQTVSLPFYGLDINQTGVVAFYLFNDLEIDKANERDTSSSFTRVFSHSTSDGTLFTTSELDNIQFADSEQEQAGSATFSGTWTYQKLDTNGDSKLDYLVIDAPVDVTRAGVFGTDDEAYLYTNTSSSGEEELIFNMKPGFQYYDAGSQTYQFVFLGRTFNNSLSMSVDNFYVGGSSSSSYLNYNTTLWTKTSRSSYDTFENDTIDSYVDKADADGRRFFDTLSGNDFTPAFSAMLTGEINHSFVNSSSQLIQYVKFSVEVEVFEAGQYKLSLDELYSDYDYDSYSNTSIWLEPSIYQIQLYFPTTNYFYDKNLDTFQIDYLQISTEDNEYVHDIDNPGYSFDLPNDDIEPGEAELLSLSGITVDHVNLDETLQSGQQHLVDEVIANVPVQVYLEGEYSLNLDIYDKNGGFIDYGSNTTWLDEGLQSVQIRFNAYDIRYALSYDMLSNSSFRFDTVELHVRNSIIDNNITRTNPIAGSQIDTNDLNFDIHFNKIDYSVDTSNIMVYTEFETDNGLWSGNKYVTMVLADSNGDPLLRNSTRAIVPNTFERKAIATFLFDAQILEKNGFDGPYQIRNWTIFDNNENSYVYPMLGEFGHDITTSQFDPHEPQPKLDVEVTLDPVNVEGGDTVDYTVRIENVGDEEAIDVSLETIFEGPNVVLLDSINQTSWTQINPGEVEYASGSISVLELTSSYQAPVDFLFIFDLSGSMGQEIGAIKDKAVDLLNLISATIPDFQVGILVHGWSEYDEQTLLDFRNMVQLTTNMTVLVEYINNADARGGDEPLGDAAWLANNWAGWRDNSIKFVQLIGDEAADHGYVVGDGPGGSGKYNGSELYEQAYTARNMGIKYISVLTDGYSDLTETQFKAFANITKGKLVYLSSDASELPELTLDFITSSMQDASVLVKAKVTYKDPQNNDYTSTAVDLLNYGSAFPTIGTVDVTQGSSTVTIDVSVTDGSGVDTVLIEHNVSVYDPQNPGATDPSNLSFQNLTATDTGSENLWQVDIDVSSFTDYILQFNVYANDTNGNMVKAGDDGTPYYAAVSVSDNTDPSINTVARTPDGEIQDDDSTQVYADISDTGSNVTTVTMYYSIDDGPWQSMSMSLLNGTQDAGWWTATLGQFSTGTRVKYYILAFDYYGNRVKDDNGGVYYNYKVASEAGQDNERPQISNTFINPSNPVATQNVEVSATITDNVGIHNATLYYSTNTSTFEKSLMTLDSGDTYVGVIPASYLQVDVKIYFSIEAIDTSKNVEQSDPNQFIPKEATETDYGQIVITRPLAGQEITSSNDVTVVANVSNAIGTVQKVEARLDSNSWFALSEDTKDIYTGTVNDVSNGSHTFTAKLYLSGGVTENDTVSFTVNYSEDTDAAPTAVEIHSPSEGQVLSTSRVPVLAEITDDGSSVTVEAKIDDGSWETMTVKDGSDYGYASGSFGASYNFTGIAEGTHTVTVRVTDSSGQTDSMTNNFQIDLPDPTTSPDTTSSTTDTNSTTSDESGGGFLDFPALAMVSITLMAIPVLRRRFK